ncbi:MAG: hypothetical protein KJ606_03055 [Chloroflexi bacterium]|nr:hypothetical protein [Chloroflexota bacterium]
MKDVAGLLLDITYKGGKKKKYLLKTGKTIIGRMPDCDIVLIETMSRAAMRRSNWIKANAR